MRQRKADCESRKPGTIFSAQSGQNPWVKLAAVRVEMYCSTGCQSSCYSGSPSSRRIFLNAVHMGTSLPSVLSISLSIRFCRTMPMSTKKAPNKNMAATSSLLRKATYTTKPAAVAR